MSKITKEEYQHGKQGMKYGIWNTIKKKWQFDICEDTPMLAEARLFQKIGDGARKHRFETRRLPNAIKPRSTETVSLTEIQKDWLRNLYLREAEECRGAASNNHHFALGSEGEEAAQFEEYAEENRNFAVILESMAKDIR